MSFFLLSSAHAFTCGETITRNPKPVSPGCERLQVIVHNTTQYTFIADSTYTATSSTGGTAILGAGSFSDIPPDSQNNNSPTTINLDGEDVGTNDADKVDTSMRYNATLNGKRIGPQLIVYAQKNSCNVYKATVTFDDERCYSHYTTGDCSISCSHSCALNDNCNGGCSYECVTWDESGSICLAYGHHKDNICTSSFAYKSTNCANGSDVINPAVNSSVAVDPGLYTVGATDSGEDSLKLYTTYSNFTCGKPTECNSSNKGNCVSSLDDQNKPARLEFYIKASPIEKLTVTFPFNVKSPQGKILKDAVYNNLNVKYLNSLGSYYSMNPVGFTDASLQFSALCNAAVCP